MFQNFARWALVPALLLLCSPLYAEPVAESKEDAQPFKNHSVNANPFGLLAGSYSFNYVYLTPEGNGFVGELSYSSSSSTDGSESSATGAGLGYRWHWNPKQQSGFIGAQLAYGVGTGSAQVNGTKFDVDTTALTVTANIGKRWQWDSGFNITFRIGGGWGSYSASTDDESPDAQKATELVNDLLSLLPIAIDGELSAGWTF